MRCPCLVHGGWVSWSCGQQSPGEALSCCASVSTVWFARLINFSVTRTLYTLLPYALLIRKHTHTPCTLFCIILKRCRLKVHKFMYYHVLAELGAPARPDGETGT